MLHKIALLLCAAALLTGVGCRHMAHCGPGHFDSAMAAPDCGCGDCGSTCGDTCGTSACGSHCGPTYDVCLPRLPLHKLRQRLIDGITCGAGCSDEIYWGEWFHDPPKCDPCDKYGNYIGPQHGPCRPGLLGVRYGNDSCLTDCGTCNHCTGHVHTERMPAEGTIIYEGAPPSRPTPRRSPVPPIPAEPISPSDQVLYELGNSSTETYPTSRGTRQPHRLGRGSF